MSDIHDHLRRLITDKDSDYHAAKIITIIKIDIADQLQGIYKQAGDLATLEDQLREFIQDLRGKQ